MLATKITLQQLLYSDTTSKLITAHNLRSRSSLHSSLKMKFSLAATAFCAISSASAAAFIERRGATVVGTIDASVGTVKDTITTDLSTIGTRTADLIEPRRAVTNNSCVA